MTKSRAILTLFRTRPELRMKDIAEMVGCTPAYVQMVRKRHTDEGGRIVRWQKLNEEERKLLAIIYRENLVNAILDGE